MPRLRPWLLPLLLAAGVLTGCATTPTPEAAADNPYAGGTTHPWSDRQDAPVADPYAAGRDYPWASPVAATGLGVQGLKTGVTYLSDLQWTEARNDWGPVERDRSNGEMDVRDGHALTIGGQTFAKGLGVHTYSAVTFTLNKQCSTFSATIGIDDEVGNRGQAVFEVMTDLLENGPSRSLYLSGVLTGRDGPVPITVDVTGAKSLNLLVYAPNRLDSDASSSIDYAHADWADARITCTAVPLTGSVNLSRAVYTSATNGWGPVETDFSNGEQRGLDGKPLTFGNPETGAWQTSDLGLGVHAPSTVTYTPDGACTVLSGVLGLDREVMGRGSVRGRIVGDGRTLWESPLLTGSTSARFNVDVSGIRSLGLVVTDGGDNKNFDHADWINPVLTCTPAGTTSSLFLDRAYGVNGQAVTGSVTDSVMEPGGNVVVVSRTGLARYSPSGQLLARAEYVFPGFDDFFISLTRQSDGKFLVTDHQGSSSRQPPFLIARFNQDLTPDTTFGQGGYVTSVAVEGLVLNAGGVPTQQPDGKLIMTADPGVPYPSTLFLIRLNTDGTLDTTYGTNGHVVFPTLTVTPIGAVEPSMLYLGSVQGLPDGKAMVTGAVRGRADGPIYPVAMRLLSTGVLDRSFGSGGVVTLSSRPLFVFVDSPYYPIFGQPRLVIQPDGRLLALSVVVCGTTDATCFTQQVTRLQATGQPDRTVTLSSSDVGGAFGIARVNPDGSVLLGVARDNGTCCRPTFDLARLNPDLTVDRAFRVDWGSAYVETIFRNRLVDVHVDPLGGVVVVSGEHITRLIR